MVREEFYNNLYLAHHGIDGQKWGKRNGPPYPLDKKDLSPAEKKANNYAKSEEKSLKKAIDEKNKKLEKVNNKLQNVTSTFLKNKKNDLELGKELLEKQLDKLHSMTMEELLSEKKMVDKKKITAGVTNFGVTAASIALAGIGSIPFVFITTPDYEGIRDRTIYNNRLSKDERNEILNKYDAISSARVYERKYRR